MKDFETMLQGHMTRRQVKAMIDQRVRNGELLKHGIRSGTYYTLSPQYIETQRLAQEAADIGLKAIQKKKQNVQEMSKEKDRKE